MTLDEHDLESKYPSIRWREPAWITQVSTGLRRIACRFCLAFYDLDEANFAGLFTTEEDHAEHVAMFHTVPKGDPGG